MERFPIVTIIAACYNHEKYVIECLEAIRNQTYPNIQLIITDDCSTDRSVELIETWITTQEIKCNFIKHVQNIGLPRTLNQALEIATGEYISIIATDDYWLPEFISTYVMELENRSPEYGLAYGNSFLINEEGILLPRLKKTNPNFPDGYVLREFLANAMISTNAVLIRASCFCTVGLYDESLYYEDLDMWIRILSRFKAVYISKILANYRIVPSSISQTHNKKYVDSIVKILTKLLNDHPEYSREVEDRFANISIFLYETHHPLRIKYLALKFWKKKTKRNLFILTCALLNISYQKCQKLINQYSKLVSEVSS